MGLLKALFGLGGGPAKKKSRRKAKRVGGGYVPSDVSGSAASIVLADVDGSGGEKITQQLADIFAAISDVAVYRRNQAVKLNAKAPLFNALQESARTGSEWLREDEADLLVWGGTVDLGTAVELRFLPVGAAEGAASTFGPLDHLTLPIPMPRDLYQLILVSAMGSLLPVHRGARKKLAAVLEGEMKDLEKVWDSPPHLEPPHLASCLTCYGNVCLSLWRVGAKKYLAKGLKAYQDAVKTIDKSEHLLLWALAQNHFAEGLQLKSLQDADPDALAAAAAAYREVADALGRDNYPNEFALAMINMAMVLYKIGNKETTPARLKEAAQAFEEALSAFDPELNPGRWAEAMNGYGTVLLSLAERAQGPELAAKAVDAFKQALDVRKKDLVPLLWAQTANNLGAACFALAKRQPSKELVADAQKYFTGASEIYRAAGNQKRVIVIEKNLQRVKQMARGA
ncbi:MAG: hypothetical protein COW30_15225 [Rhodospirillales bacterium CG15_BIG_FIL_POST_REV_8_21_14_020_66_15]|nr:MAG: hypothetical protein COW30_15225 [Rhodospirillales bacterium CG15_BIG_FIL_POST_REV_8_21_14_020_66_15]